MTSLTVRGAAVARGVPGEVLTTLEVSIVRPCAEGSCEKPAHRTPGEHEVHASLEVTCTPERR